ncbi:hypothetical protein D3C85_1912790 [compost metagenome]
MPLFRMTASSSDSGSVRTSLPPAYTNVFLTEFQNSWSRISREKLPRPIYVAVP